MKPTTLPTRLFVFLFAVILSSCDSNRTSSGSEDKFSNLENRVKDATEGDAEAQFDLGFLYYQGTDVSKNDDEAVKWFKKAADHGHRDAQYYMARCYEDGKGVQQDLTEAIKWYRKAANQGHRLSQYLLGAFYASGKGIPQDDAEAAKWMAKAAEQGDADAQFTLAGYYLRGKGVSQNDGEALKWCIKAADQENAPAQLLLGSLYAEGREVTKDDAMAFKWYRILWNCLRDTGCPTKRFEGFLLKGHQLSRDQGSASSHMSRLLSEIRLASSDIFGHLFPREHLDGRIEECCGIVEAGFRKAPSDDA